MLPEVFSMARFLIRKLGSRGDTCVAVAEQELAGHLGRELRMYSAAIRSDEGPSVFIGNGLGQVMKCVEGEVAKGAAEVEVLLIPPVAGGQPSPREAFEVMAKTGEAHVLPGIVGDEGLVVPEGVIDTERLIPLSFVFDFFREHPSAQVRLHVYGYRRALKSDFTHAQSWHDIYEEGYRRLYLGTVKRDSDGCYWLRDSLPTRGQTSLLTDSDGLDEFKLGREDAVREVVEACGVALRSGQNLTLDFARKFAQFATRSWRVPERRSFETLKRTLGDEIADKLLREGWVNVRSRNGREYAITADGEVFIPKHGGAREPVCVYVDGESKLPSYDRVLAKYLVIRDRPEQISTLREALGRCTRCGGEIRLGDTHAAVTLETEVFVDGQERGEYDVDVIEAEALCYFCDRCYLELNSKRAFGMIEEFLSR
jgi:hypothetical protein